MKFGSLFGCCGVVAFTFINSNARGAVVVPGTANPWLAGMPEGTEIDSDSAGYDSPVMFLDVPITPGSVLSFTVTGSVTNDGNYPAVEGPDGGFNAVPQWGDVAQHYTGDANGMSGVRAPFNALMGVFLGPRQPDHFTAPADLDFSTPESRNFTTLSPDLRQVFFIGDGKTDAGAVQQFVVPAGATRLYLAAMDASGWNDNCGSFEVSALTFSATPATPVPEPATLAALGLPAALLGLRRRRARK